MKGAALRLVILVAAIAVAGGLWVVERRSGGSDVDALYFESPEQAVPIVADLLLGEDFATLARYYCLEDADLVPEDLESGDYFIRRERPEIAHPAGSWRYRHPFPPGYAYIGDEMAHAGHIHVVTVGMDIEQGEGQPVQTGLQHFLMIRSAEGWQILPGDIDQGAGRPAPF